MNAEPTPTPYTCATWDERCDHILALLDPDTAAARFVQSVQNSIVFDRCRYPTERQRFWLDYHGRSVGLPDANLAAPKRDYPTRYRSTPPKLKPGERQFQPGDDEPPLLRIVRPDDGEAPKRTKYKPGENEV